MTFRDKIKTLIEAGFEFGEHNGFLLGPPEPGAGGSQRVFNPPEQESDENDLFEHERVFRSIEDMEGVIDQALEYAREQGLVEEYLPPVALMEALLGYRKSTSQAEDPPSQQSPRKGLRCLVCETTIVSKHRHDFQTCNCPRDSGTKIFLDGGTDYSRVAVEDNAEYEWVYLPEPE